MTAASLVPRPRLAGRVRAALDAGWLLLHAGAGFGKSTLLDEALGEAGHPVAWVVCTDADRTPGRLLATVLGALGAALPGVADPLLERLSSGERVDLGGAERWLLEDLDALLVDRIVLVVDEAERLDGAGEALAVLDGLLGEVALLRVAVATRSPLDLAARPADTIGEEDLAFTADEYSAVVAARLGRSPERRELERALQVSLAWPLGLALGAPADVDFATFLDEHVLASAPAELRDALIDASAVDRLSPAVIDALGLPGELAERATAIGLPLRAVGGPPGTVAFHPLVRDHLRSRFEAERTPEQRRAVLARVAAPLAAEGRLVEAVEAWLDAQAWAEALSALARDLPVLLSTAPGSVRTWLARLPAPVRREPVARLLAGRLAYAEGDHASAADELRQADAGLAGPGTEAARLSARLVLGECLFWLGELEELARLADDVDFEDPDDLGALRAAVLAWSAQGMAALGDVDGAARVLRRLRRVDPALAALHEAPHAALVAAPAGATDRAIELLDARLRAVRSGRPFERPELDVALAALLLADQGRVDAALERADRLVADAEGAQARPFMRAVAYVLRAWLLAAAGRAEEAELALAPVGRPAVELWPLAYVDAALAMTAEGRGRTADAAAAAERALTAARRAPLVYRTLLILALGPVLAGAGRDERALALVQATLAELDERLPGGHGAYHRARLLAVRAWLRFRHGGLESAGADLETALRCAGAGAQHLMRAAWPLLEEVTWVLLEQGLVDADLLLDALEAAMPASDALLALSDHPEPAVRRRVLAALAASGRPDALGRLAALGDDPDADVAATARRLLARTRATPPPRSFTLLGGFALRRGDYVVDERAWGRPMVQRLVRFLLVHRGSLVAEELILEAFWPGRPARSARSSLHVTVSRARSVLDAPGAQRSVIDFAERSYRLVLDERDRVDVDAFELAAATALTDTGPGRRATLERAAAWWTGEPLPEDRYADWASDWRDRLVRRYTTVLRALLQVHLEAGDHAAAVEVAHRALDLDPLDEGTQRALMVAYGRQGRRGRALRQYLECRRALVDALGIEPASETAAIQRRLLAGERV